MAKMKEYSKAYNREAINLALGNITIHQCKDCGHPCIDGYCCRHCGSDNPKLNSDSVSDIEL